MSDNIENILVKEKADVLSSFDSVYSIMEMFERDARRFNRAFSEEKEVSVK